MIKKMLKFNSFDTMYIINTGLILGVFGLLILIIYFIIIKNIMKKDDGNVLS